MLFAFFSLGFGIDLKPGKNFYNITSTTSFTVTQACHVYVAEQNNVSILYDNVKDWSIPRKFTKDSTIDVVPDSNSNSANITFLIVYDYYECSSYEYVTTPFAMVDITYNYKCVVVFSETERNFKVRQHDAAAQRVLRFITFDSKKIIKNADSITNSSFTISGAGTLGSGVKTILTIYDSDLYYPPGDYKVDLKDSLTIKLRPKMVFVAKATTGLTFTNEPSSSKIAEGIFYSDDEHSVTITKSSTEPASPVEFSTGIFECYGDKYVWFIDNDVQITNKQLNSDSCVFITSPHTHHFVFAQENTPLRTERVIIVDNQGTIRHVFRESRKSFSEFAQSAFVSINMTTDAEETYGLVSSEVLRNKTVANVRQSQWFKITGSIESAPNGQRHNFQNVHEPLNSGFFTLTVPAAGRTLEFPQQRILVFHNGQSFTGNYTFNGTTTDILAETGKYAFNVTDANGFQVNVKPTSGSDAELNITISPYPTTTAHFQDIVVLKSGEFNYFLTQYEETLSSRTNLTMRPNTKQSLLIFCQGTFQMEGQTFTWGTVPYIKMQSGNIRQVASYDSESIRITSKAAYVEIVNSNTQYGAIVNLTANVYDTATPEISGLFTGASSYTRAAYDHTNVTVAYSVVTIGTAAKQHDSDDGDYTKTVPPDKGGLWAGEIVAIVFGCIFGVVCIGASIWAIFCSKSNKRAKSTSSSSSSSSSSSKKRKKIQVQNSSLPVGAPPPQQYPYPAQPGYPQQAFAPPPQAYPQQYAYQQQYQGYPPQQNYNVPPYQPPQEGYYPPAGPAPEDMKA